MNKPFFRTANKLSKRIDTYFKLNDKSPPNKEKPALTKSTGSKKDPLAETGAATFAGLVFFLGFNSREEFEDYEQNGEFADLLKRGRLRFEAKYETLLQTSTGAVFVLKNLLKDKAGNNAMGATHNVTLNVVVYENVIPVSGSEKEVML